MEENHNNEQIVNEQINQTIVNIEEQPKKKKKGPIIAIVVILLVAIIGGLVWFFVLRKDNTNDDITNNDTQSVEPPSDAKIEESNAALSNEMSINCHIQGTLADAIKSPVKKGDIIRCSYEFEIRSGIKIAAVYYQYDYGSGLKQLEMQERAARGKNKIEGKKASDYYSLPESVFGSPMMFKFEVLDDTLEENLTFSLSNIIIKTATNDYYKLDDKNVNFKVKSTKFYIYEVKEDKSVYIEVSNVEKNDASYKLLNEYKCNNDNCSYDNDMGNYVLFQDDNPVAFNYVTGEKKVLDKFKKYAIDLVADTKLRGLILYDEDIEGYGYYLLDSNKFIYDIKKGQYFTAFDKFIYVFSDDGKIEKLIDFKGNNFAPTSSDLSKLEGTEFYYVEIDLPDSPIFLYNKDGKALFGGNAYTRYIALENGNIILMGNGKYKEYNVNEEVLFESIEYKEISILEKNYIGVVDKENTLKIIDYRDNVIHEFVKLRDDNYVHWPLSGYYEYQNKNGIYIVVEDDSITDKELRDGLTAQGEEISDYTFESDRGYEYYYIPETKESGKFVTVIGGYAKPVLYLYPEQETTVTVNFEHEDKLTTTYPKFKNEWSVLAKPNGDLYDKDGKYYYGLYWEEDLNHYVDFHEGFYVTKEKAIEFLEEKLSLIGLNDRERNEFIMYWLPILEKNGKSLVYFELTEERDSYNKMKITPQPDSVLRLAIHVKKVSNKVNIKEEKLESFNRHGFAAVEWGGVIYK